MAISLGEIQGEVLSMLSKSPGYQGFYDDIKMAKAIQESVDYVAQKMFWTGEGWLKEKREFDTTANQAAVRIPTDYVAVSAVRYLYGNVYVPLLYKDSDLKPEFPVDSGLTQTPMSWRILGDQIYFNPYLGSGGTNYLQIEGYAFPPMLKGSSSLLPDKFNRGLQHYIKYRTASILVAQLGEPNADWKEYEKQWEAEMLVAIGKKTTDKGYIGDFDG